jgi:hypothetical protein
MELILVLFLVIFVLVGVVLATVLPLVWTVRRILRPVDRAAKQRNLPFRFSLGDFLCLFWVVQLPLAFVFQIEGEETAPYYWTLMLLVWAIAPLVWITCARALSKAGITAGKHRIIFLALVVPTVYYGLFPFIAMSWAGVVNVAVKGPQFLQQHGTAVAWWVVLVVALVVCGFYSPWMIREVGVVPGEDGGEATLGSD